MPHRDTTVPVGKDAKESSVHKDAKNRKVRLESNRQTTSRQATSVVKKTTDDSANITEGLRKMSLGNGRKADTATKRGQDPSKSHAVATSIKPHITHSKGEKLVRIVAKGFFRCKTTSLISKSALHRSRMASSANPTVPQLGQSSAPERFYTLDAYAKGVRLMVPAEISPMNDINWPTLLDSGAGNILIAKQVWDAQVLETLEVPGQKKIQTQFPDRSNTIITGTLHKTTLTLGETSRVQVRDQEFYAIDNAFVEVLAGIGPREATGQLINHTTAEVPTFLENLVDQYHLTGNILGLQISPWSEDESQEYALSAPVEMGGTNEEQYQKDGIGHLDFINMSSEATVAKWYSVHLKVAYGNDEILAANSLAIVDTGCGGLSFSATAFDKYIDFLKRSGVTVISPPDNAKHNHTIPEACLPDVQPLTLGFVDVQGRAVTVEIDVLGQVFPPRISKKAGVKAGEIELAIMRHTGLPFACGLGISFLQKRRARIEVDARRIGLGKTKHWDDTNPEVMKIITRVMKERDDARKGSQAETDKKRRASPGEDASKTGRKRIR